MTTVQDIAGAEVGRPQPAAASKLQLEDFAEATRRLAEPRDASPIRLASPDFDNTIKAIEVAARMRQKIANENRAAARNRLKWSRIRFAIFTPLAILGSGILFTQMFKFDSNLYWIAAGGMMLIPVLLEALERVDQNG